MGPDGAEVRALMADRLGLTDPGHTTHTLRAPLADYAAWMASTAGSVAKMAEDVLSMVRAGEARLSGSGSSSTMPQKQNPVVPSAIVALARHSGALAAAMTSALPHRDQRDGTAWMTEWLVLPQLCIGASRAMGLARDLARDLSPIELVLAQGIDPDGLGLIHAEALSFHLARQMPRPEAQAAIKTLCQESRDNGVPLPVLAAARFPKSGTEAALDPETQLGDAPFDADRFVRAARADLRGMSA